MRCTLYTHESLGTEMLFAGVCKHGTRTAQCPPEVPQRQVRLSEIVSQPAPGVVLMCRHINIAAKSSSEMSKTFSMRMRFTPAIVATRVQSHIAVGMPRQERSLHSLHSCSVNSSMTRLTEVAQPMGQGSKDAGRACATW